MPWVSLSFSVLLLMLGIASGGRKKYTSCPVRANQPLINGLPGRTYLLFFSPHSFWVLLDHCLECLPPSIHMIFFLYTVVPLAVSSPLRLFLLFGSRIRHSIERSQFLLLFLSHPFKGFVFFCPRLTPTWFRRQPFVPTLKCGWQ